VVAIPAWLALLGPYFGEPRDLHPALVALVLAKSFLGPLVVGMLILHWLPGFARGASNPLLAASLQGPRSAVIVSVYILVSAAVSVPYLRWRRQSGATTESTVVD
jgi:hypothetical protein